MKKLIFILLLFTTFTSSAREGNLWFKFIDSTTQKFGYKDKSGNIKIEPVLEKYTTANKFDKIICIEMYGGNKESYFLTKSGEKIEGVNLYYNDNTPDCESEGFIRFKDRETYLVGMLNQNGEIAIPPEYNYLTRVYNGLTAGLKGAKQVPAGEYFVFEGGTVYLLDTNGRILVENYNRDRYLNFYSLQVSSSPNTDSLRVNFKGVNGKYYSFVDYYKEFQAFLDKLLSEDLSKDIVSEFCHDSLSFDLKSKESIYKNKDKVLESRYALIKKILYSLKSDHCNYSIDNSTNLYIYQNDQGVFAKYFNNCREANQMKYPLMTLTINNKVVGETKQNRISFLRTEQGYKLISITMTD